MTNKFEIVVSAADKASKPIDQVSKRLGALDRAGGKAAKAIGQQFKALKRGADDADESTNKQGEGLKRLGKTAEGLGRIGKDLATNYGPAASLLTMASAAGIAKFATNWSAEGFSVDRSAKSMGVTTGSLQGLRGAAELAGMDPNSAEGALANFARNLQDARYNRNDSVSSFMTAKGMKFRYTPDGRIDSMAMLRDVSRLMKLQTDPQAANVVASQFGVESIAPILREGPEALDQLQEQARKAGLIQSDADLRKNEKLVRSANRLKGSFKGLLGQSINKYAPGLSNWLDKQSSENEDSVEDLRQQQNKSETPRKPGSLQPPGHGVVEEPTYQQGSIPNRWWAPPRQPGGDTEQILRGELSRATNDTDRSALVRELQRLGVKATPQHVKVEVAFKNAPPGTSVKVMSGAIPGDPSELFYSSASGLGSGR